MIWFEGKRVAQNGQLYTCVGFKPYTKASGEIVTLVRLLSACATCRKSFEAAVPDGSTASFSRRCQKHKKPGVAAKRRRA